MSWGHETFGLLSSTKFSAVTSLDSGLKSTRRSYHSLLLRNTALPSKLYGDRGLDLFPVYLRR